MATISDLRADIETDVLKRTDMTATINNAIRDFYRTLCNKIPFEELQEGPVTLACVADQQSYNLTSLLSAATKPALAGICSLRIEYTSAHVLRLKRDHVRNYDSMSVPASSKPVKYARWGSTIELWPPPNSTYSMKLRYWHKPTIDGTLANTTLDVPDEWLELIKWEAVYRLYTVLNRPIDAMALIAPSQLPHYPSSKKIQMHDIGIIPRLWNDLLQTISQRENIDEDFSINPLVRRYTHA